MSIRMSTSISMSKTLEICTGDPVGIDAAIAGGADRIELCSGLAEGGLTPSIGAIRYAASRPVTVNVLIRPRPGDFVYSPREIELMVADIEEAVRGGADGIVVGALTPDGDVDMDACRRFIEASQGRNATFHRAFDVCRNPFQALEDVISLGFDRILTSGQASDALHGADMIRRLHDKAAGRIRIMAGAGVKPENAAEILALSRCDDLHASARSLIPSGMTARAGEASMGSADAADGSRMATDRNVVAQLKSILSNSPL